MHILTFTFLLIATAGTALAQGWKADAERIYEATRTDAQLWPLLADFCDHHPRRLSGSENLEKGIDWLIARMTQDGWNVRTQKVKVPAWVRGNESLAMTLPLRHAMPMCGLGGSVGTDGKPLVGNPLVVSSFDELRRRGSEARGRIVVYNVPFTNYGATVAYRYNGAAEAARYGAIAALVRSVGPYGLQTVHTGVMAYNDSLPKIPAAAITIEDALLLARMQERGEEVSLTLAMEAHTRPDADSRNVIMEIKGSELPNEVVVMGGHIDSWDLGSGAMDDAGGCFAAWRVLHHIRTLGIRPRRTIRVCFWTNEENGTRGGKGYAEQTTTEKHVMGIESDGGTFRPMGFSTNATGALKAVLQDATGMLARIGATDLEQGDGGADTGPLRERGVPVMELVVDTSKYFWYHHTEADTPDKVLPHELNDCVYAMAVMALACANM